MSLNKIKSIALKENYKTLDIGTYWDGLEEYHCTKDLGVSYNNIKS